MTMGIPVKYLPVTLDGVLHTENHQRWLQYRTQQEQASMGSIEEDAADDPMEM